MGKLKWGTLRPDLLLPASNPMRRKKDSDQTVLDGIRLQADASLRWERSRPIRSSPDCSPKEPGNERLAGCFHVAPADSSLNSHGSGSCFQSVSRFIICWGVTEEN